MENSKKKIINKLHESNDKNAMKKAFDTRLKDAEDIVKSSLGSNTPPEDVKDIAARLATESVNGDEAFNPVVQYHSNRTDETPFMINGTKWQYVNAIYPNGKKDIAVYRYGHDLAYDYKWFMDNVIGKLKNANQSHMEEGENDSVGRGIEAGMNPETEADKYEEYRKLMAQLAAEEGDDQPIKEDDTVTPERTNNPVKLKADVAKLMSKLDMSSIAPYLQKIDNPTEQAEVIAQFAEKIGIPKSKLSSVISQLRTVAEAKMTKKELIETVTGRKIIKTIKVKDIK